MNWAIKCYDAVTVGDYFWFSSKEYNGLFQVNRLTGQGICKGYFPHEDLYIQNAHLKCFKHKELLIFIPLMAHYIHIYNMETNEFSEIPIDKENEWRIREAIIDEHKIWMFPNTIKQDMLMLDLTDYRLTSVSSFRKQCEMFLGKESVKYITIGSQNKRKVWFAIYDTNIVFNWDIDSGKIDFIETDVKRISSVLAEEDKIWLLSTVTTDIYSYLLHESKSTKYSVDSDYECTEDGLHRPYYQIIKLGEEMFVIPAFSKSFLKFERERFINICQIQENKNTSLAFYNYFISGDKLWVLAQTLPDNYVFDLKGNFINKLSFSNVDVEFRKRMAHKRMIEKGIESQDGNVLEESKYFDLNDYLLGIQYDLK